MMSSDYSFDNFLADNTNGMALMLSSLMAQNPENTGKFLWIFGGTGRGKSHLLKSIYHWVNTHTDKSVKYMDASEVAESILKNLITETPDPSSAENCDYLIIDNMDSLFCRNLTQMEFARMFIRNIMRGQKIIVASDYSPSKFGELISFVRVLDKDGQVVAIDAPSAQVLKRYSHKLIDRYKFNITEDAVEFLANNARSFPTVTGALTTAQFECKRFNRRIDRLWMEDYFSNLRG